MEYESPEALYQSGRIAEALVRQLLSMKEFPQESGPYLYFDGSHQVLRGTPLWLIFIVFVACLFAGSYFIGGRFSVKKLAAWGNALPHFPGLWLPLMASLSLLPLFVEIGIMDKYHIYPATAKDEPLFESGWPAVILFLVGLVVFLIIGRKLAGRFSRRLAAPTPNDMRSLALFVVGVAAVHILMINPFSLLFLVPMLLWFLIKGRRGASTGCRIVCLGRFGCL
jgi:hypothetical protein